MRDWRLAAIERDGKIYLEGARSAKTPSARLIASLTSRRLSLSACSIAHGFIFGFRTIWIWLNLVGSYLIVSVLLTLVTASMTGWSCFLCFRLFSGLFTLVMV